MRNAIIMVLATAVSCCYGLDGRSVAVSPAAQPSADEIRQKLESAYALLREDQVRAAVSIFEEILKADPKNQQAVLELAYLHLRLNERRAAVKYLDDAVAVDPDNPRLRMELGYARQALDEPSAAADEFELVQRSTGEFQAQASAALKAVRDSVAATTPEARQDNFLNEGYDALRRDDIDVARDRFKRALLEDPRKAHIYRQLGYMDLADGHLKAAAQEFEGAHKLEMGDYQTALQLGYLYDSLHNDDKAEENFRNALGSPDAKVHQAAEEGLARLKAARQRIYLDVEGSPYYTSRFADTIAYVDGRLTYKPALDFPLAFYAHTGYTQDSRSHVSGVPELFADNEVLSGAGVRLQPEGFNASLSAEANAAFNLMRTPLHSQRIEPDYRVTLADYNYFEPRWLGRRGFADGGGSVGYYSRYRDNIIGLLQLRVGFKLWDGETTVVRAYAPVNVIKDRNRDFFNNVFETGAGLELQPYIKENVKLRAEYLHGAYMGISGLDPNPYRPHYDDFRVILIFSKRFGLHE